MIPCCRSGAKSASCCCMRFCRLSIVYWLLTASRRACSERLEVFPPMSSLAPADGCGVGRDLSSLRSPWLVTNLIASLLSCATHSKTRAAPACLGGKLVWTKTGVMETYENKFCRNRSTADWSCNKMASMVSLVKFTPCVLRHLQTSTSPVLLQFRKTGIKRSKVWETRFWIRDQLLCFSSVEVELVKLCKLTSRMLYAARISATRYPVQKAQSHERPDKPHVMPQEACLLRLVSCVLCLLQTLCLFSGEASGASRFTYHSQSPCAANTKELKYFNSAFTSFVNRRRQASAEKVTTERHLRGFLTARLRFRDRIHLSTSLGSPIVAAQWGVLLSAKQYSIVKIMAESVQSTLNSMPHFPQDLSLTMVR